VCVSFYFDRFVWWPLLSDQSAELRSCRRGVLGRWRRGLGEESVYSTQEMNEEEEGSEQEKEHKQEGQEEDRFMCRRHVKRAGGHGERHSVPSVVPPVPARSLRCELLSKWEVMGSLRRPS
jgi:hypothetical protein